MKNDLDIAAPLADPIAEEAVAWFARIHSDLRTRADEDRFAHWLDQDERHTQAYLQVQDLWRAAGPQITPRPLSMRGSGRWRPLSLTPKIAVAAALVAAVSSTVFFMSRDRTIGQGSFATATGIQQALKLSDGSTVTLNTSSEVSIDLGKDRRTIRLTRGEARFNVAKDPHRPFVVEAGAARIQALGTAFDVRMSSSRLAVTLMDGKVAVTAPLPATGGRGTTLLTRGQQLAVDLNNGKQQVQPVNLDKANAWLNRQLIFDAVPLADAVEEANRYLSHPIVIRDAELKSMRVSGVVRAGSQESFIGSLESSFPVQALETPEGMALVQKN